MNLKNMLNDKSQKQKATYYMIPFIRNVQNRQIQRQKADEWLPGGGGRRRRGREGLLMGTGFLLEVIKMFWNYAVVLAQLCEHTKNH